jgi:chromosome segregation ATPase
MTFQERYNENKCMYTKYYKIVKELEQKINKCNNEYDKLNITYDINLEKMNKLIDKINIIHQKSLNECVNEYNLIIKLYDNYDKLEEENEKLLNIYNEIKLEIIEYCNTIEFLNKKIDQYSEQYNQLVIEDVLNQLVNLIAVNT